MKRLLCVFVFLSACASKELNVTRCPSGTIACQMASSQTVESFAREMSGLEEKEVTEIIHKIKYKGMRAGAGVQTRSDHVSQDLALVQLHLKLSPDQVDSFYYETIGLTRAGAGTHNMSPEVASRLCLVRMMGEKDGLAIRNELHRIRYGEFLRAGGDQTVLIHEVGLALTLAANWFKKDPLEIRNQYLKIKYEHMRYQAGLKTQENDISLNTLFDQLEKEVPLDERDPDKRIYKFLRLLLTSSTPK